MLKCNKLTTIALIGLVPILLLLISTTSSSSMSSPLQSPLSSFIDSYNQGLNYSATLKRKDHKKASSSSSSKKSSSSSSKGVKNKTNENNLISSSSSKVFSQARNLYLMSKKMLRRAQAESDESNECLVTCSKKLGHYTRLAIIRKHNKQDSSTQAPLEFIAKIITAASNQTTTNRSEEVYEVHMHQVNERVDLAQLNKSTQHFQVQPLYALYRELTYYLVELEQNYKLIQELQAKIESMNVTSEAAAGVLSPAKHATHNKTAYADCSSVNGHGFVQLELAATNTHFTGYCEDHWLVVQQRQNGFETSFNRTWSEYARGFGSMRGDFWLGLELMAQLTQARPHELLVELTDWNNQVYVARYEHFVIGGEPDFYALSLSGKYAGNASKELLDDVYFGLTSQNGAPFSTFDRRKPAPSAAPNTTTTTAVTKSGKKKTSTTTSLEEENQHVLDEHKNCAAKSGGGWWFNNFSTCLPVNLNGVYVTGASAPSARGIKWQAVRAHDRNYALKSSKMKIRALF